MIGGIDTHGVRFPPINFHLYLMESRSQVKKLCFAVCDLPYFLSVNDNSMLSQDTKIVRISSKTDD
jgi:hypothetical protein